MCKALVKSSVTQLLRCQHHRRRTARIWRRRLSRLVERPRGLRFARLRLRLRIHKHTQIYISIYKNLVKPTLSRRFCFRTSVSKFRRTVPSDPQDI